MNLRRLTGLIAMFLAVKGGAWKILSSVFYDLYMTLSGIKGRHSRRFLLSVSAIFITLFTLLLAITKNPLVGILDLLAIALAVSVERTF